MINSQLVCPTPILPPQSLLDSTYSALKKRVREALFVDWASRFPTPGYYISKKGVCSGRIGIASGGRKSVWSILSAQPALRSP